jgi:hypothetical protein
MRSASLLYQVSPVRDRMASSLRVFQMIALVSRISHMTPGRGGTIYVVPSAAGPRSHPRPRRRWGRARDGPHRGRIFQQEPIDRHDGSLVGFRSSRLSGRGSRLTLRLLPMTSSVGRFARDAPDPWGVYRKSCTRQKWPRLLPCAPRSTQPPDPKHLCRRRCRDHKRLAARLSLAGQHEVSARRPDTGTTRTA